MAGLEKYHFGSVVISGVPLSLCSLEDFRVLVDYGPRSCCDMESA